MEEVSEVDKAEEDGSVDEKVKTDKGKTDEKRWSVVAQKILSEALVAEDSDETLNRLKKASDSLVSYV